jgi:hypothetical protein
MLHITCKPAGFNRTGHLSRDTYCAVQRPLHGTRTARSNDPAAVLCGVHVQPMHVPNEWILCFRLWDSHQHAHAVTACCNALLSVH